MFSSIIENSSYEVSQLTVTDVLTCTLVSLVLGLIIAAVYMFKGTYTKSLIITLVILPVIVQAVIMMVNGNLGAGVAVMGAFSLVRYRSAPGTSKEISAVFLAMAVGLACGMGYLTFAAVMTVIVCLVLVILNVTPIGEADRSVKSLKVVIPESLDYTTVFDDIFAQYCTRSELVKVKTTNLGSMFELSYRIRLKDAKEEKKLIDAIRVRNGNLNVMISQPQDRGVAEEL